MFFNLPSLTLTNNQEKSVFIATPMYGGMCVSKYLIGVLDTFKVLSENNYTLLFAHLTNESLITRARNELVRQFLETDAQYFIFIDADIGFMGKDVLRLIETDKDVVCGLYPKKDIDWDRVNFAAGQGRENLQDYAASYVCNILDLPEEELNKPITSPIIEIKHGGTGFMLIKRSVFERLSSHVPEYVMSTIPKRDGTPFPKTKEFFTTSIEEGAGYLMSEDYYFCNLWQKHGGKIYTNLDIKLSHTGSYTFKGNIFQGGLNINGC